MLFSVEVLALWAAEGAIGLHGYFYLSTLLEQLFWVSGDRAEAQALNYWFSILMPVVGMAQSTARTDTQFCACFADGLVRAFLFAAVACSFFAIHAHLYTPTHQTGIHICIHTLTRFFHCMVIISIVLFFCAGVACSFLLAFVLTVERKTGPESTALLSAARTSSNSGVNLDSYQRNNMIVRGKYL